MTNHAFQIGTNSGSPVTSLTDLDDLIVLKSNIAPGNLYAIGLNNYGQLGLGDCVNRSSPVQVGSLTNWKSIYPGSSYTLGLKTDGTLWSWGINTYGTLGLGDTIGRSSPVQVGSMTNWASLPTCGYGNPYAAAIKSDGTLWTWGPGNNGGLGLGNTPIVSSPVQVGLLNNWAQVSIGNFHMHAVKTDGTLWGWGQQGFGELGLGDCVDYSSPTQVGNLNNWRNVSASYMTVATKTDGTLWTWGRNLAGELAQGNMAHLSSPVQVGALTSWQSACSENSGLLAIQNNGTIWGAGSNAITNTAGNVSSLVQVGALGNWKNVYAQSNSTAIKTDGTAWIWGTGIYGELGLGVGGVVYNYSPTLISTATNWKSIFTGNHSTFLLAYSQQPILTPYVSPPVPPGYFYAWGRNDRGQLGLGDTIYRSSPVQVGSLTTWQSISSGGLSGTGFTAGVRSDGTMWTWGYNSSWQLGLGDNIPRSSPVQVGSLTNWKSVSCGGQHVIATKNDGTVWGWGANYGGELGLGNTVNYLSSPVQLGISNLQSFSCGYQFTAAVTTTGKLFTWGNNQDGGTLGLGNQGIASAGSASSPVQVGLLTNWQSVSAGYHSSLAIKTDGTLWSWGHSTFFNLGLGDDVSRSSPSQVGSLTNWQSVSAGLGNTSAIKTDGTLWTWGNDTSTMVSSPVQVGISSNWKTSSSLLYGFMATKTDGTLWSWGANSNGQLGLGDTIYRSSPVQVIIPITPNVISTGGDSLSSFASS